MMRLMTCTAALIAIGSVTAIASDRTCDFTALSKPVSALSPPVSAIKGDPRVCATAQPPRNSVWQGIQPALDRSSGRIEDGATWEIPRIELSRHPQRAFDLLRYERDRELRIDAQRLSLEQLDERQRRNELDRREYELISRAPLSPMARQADADLVAIESAQAERDRALIEASNALTRALEQPGAVPAALKAAYQATRSEIRQRYEQERSRILGD